MKSVVKIVAMMAIVCVVALKAYNKQNEVRFSDVVLANVEALAEDESSNGGSSTNKIKCYSGKGSSFLCKCSTCTWGYVGTSKSSTCY